MNKKRGVVSISRGEIAVKEFGNLCFLLLIFFLFEFQIRQTSLVNDDYGYHGDRKI